MPNFKKILETSLPLEQAHSILLAWALLVVIPACSAVILWGLLPVYVGW